VGDDGHVSDPDPSPNEAVVAVVRPAVGAGTAAVLTFVASASILVIEIAAARLVAPFVGNSLTVYTSIIGIILAGIALGAWAGGRVSDRLAPTTLLGPAFVLGGLAAIASVPIVGLLGPVLAGTGGDGGLLLSLVAFTMPAAILAAVAPMLVRATITDVASSGSLVGRLSAIGTAGALVGTFLTGYVLLGLVPVRTLIVGTGVLLLVAGVALQLLLGRRDRHGVVAVLAVVGLALGLASTTIANPCQRESPYYCIAVRIDGDNAAGRTLVLDDLRHAHVDLEDATALEFAYIQWFAAATADLTADAAPLDALHVGGGGFSFPRYLRAIDPVSRHLVLELDPVVLATAREQLGFAPDEAIEVRLGDARRTILGVPTDSRRLVVGDAFGGRSVPWHLTTTEFVREIDRVLTPDGRYVQNLIDGPALRFVRAETATLRQVFEHVAVITWNATFDGSGGGNVVLVASHEPFDAAAIDEAVRSATAGAHLLTGDEALDAFTEGAPILTDDFAPADQLIGG
jgi:spermidine synthase